MEAERGLGTRDGGSAASTMAPGDIRIGRPGLYHFSKRCFDLLMGLAILVMLLPVVPLIALMIKLDGRGPVFFSQDRVGKGGRIFKFYKFRSMRENADADREQLEPLNEQGGPVFKMRSDPRVTSVGRFLRQSSLDEIPQIFNVLKGDMSIVGPRPHLAHEVEHYTAWQRRRLEVMPGITCLWQISGRSHISFDEWMRLDLEYIKTRSFRTDLLIFMKTVPAVMARRGAY